ncbi:MAG: hypothetical protein LH618_08315, partial [Saprospiraceae bacterium]|nr:hypothetical protein [Saprospiraceae bacterium]
DGVTYNDDDPAKGAQIAFQLHQKMAFQLEIEIIYADNTKERRKLPVEIWQRGAEWTMHLHSTKAIRKVVTDPDHLLPDINPKNNSWKDRP